MTTHDPREALDDAALDRLVAAYTPPVVPPCRVCGGELSIASVGGGEPTRWAWSGQEDDPERPGYLRAVPGLFGNAPKGSPSEFGPCGHYHESVWIDRRQGGDPAVVRLVNAYRAALTPAPAEDVHCQMDWMPKGMHTHVWTCRVCGRKVERNSSDGHPHVRCLPAPAADVARLVEALRRAHDWLQGSEPHRARYLGEVLAPFQRPTGQESGE